MTRQTQDFIGIGQNRPALTSAGKMKNLRMLDKDLGNKINEYTKNQQKLPSEAAARLVILAAPNEIRPFLAIRRWCYL